MRNLGLVAWGAIVPVLSLWSVVVYVNTWADIARMDIYKVNEYANRISCDRLEKK